MPEPKLTREFSICLLPDAGTADNVRKLRDMLPASPYRDDTPHITLLRGITAPKLFGDDELVSEIKSILDPPSLLPLTATVQEVANRSNQLYSSSGVVLFETTDELLGIRSRVIGLLLNHDYMVEEGERRAYHPHMTIRLGVPLEGEQITTARDSFPAGGPIKFNGWSIFRLYTQNDKRIMHELAAE